MLRLWNRFKDNATAIGVFCMVLGIFGGFAKFAVVNPIHQRFDDINLRIGEIHHRFADLREDMTARFDAQDKYIRGRFSDLDHRFEAIDQRFDAIDQRFDAVDQRFDAQDRRIDSLKADFTRGFEQLTSEISELRKLGERVSRNETNIDSILRQLRTADQPTP